MTCHVEPLGCCVVLQCKKPKEKTYGDSGIIVATDMDVEHTDTGVVLSMGEFAFSEYKETKVEVGDTVCYDRYEGKAMQDKDDPNILYRIVSDDRIWGKLTDE